MKQHQRPTENLSEIASLYRVKTPSAIFLDAVAEGSNREQDWLWYAEQVSGDGERRYCYERALYINPNSQAAQRHLADPRKRVARPVFGWKLWPFLRLRKSADSVSPSLS